MKTLSILLVTGLLALAGCGDDDDDAAGAGRATPRWSKEASGDEEGGGGRGDEEGRGRDGKEEPR